MSLEDLQAKAAKSTETIEQLKKKIEQIKRETAPAFMSEKAKKLRAENEALRAEVEKLKVDVKAKIDSTPISATDATIQKPLPNGEAKQDEKPKAECVDKKDKTTKKQENKKPEPPKKEELKPADVNVSHLDIRVGKIVEVKKHPEADLLYVEQIDLGEGKTRTVCSGLVKYIPIEKMQDKLVVCVCNLKPAKLKGVLSEAMVLCASTPECVELIEVPAGATIGDRISAAGFDGEPAAECTPKNNIFGLVCPDLKTNDSLVATYKGVPLEIKGKGHLTSVTLKSAPVK